MSVPRTRKSLACFAIAAPVVGALSGFVSACGLWPDGQGRTASPELAAEVATSLDEAVASQGAPLRITQAEFQTTAEGDTWWITQYDDLATTAYGSGVDTESVIYRFPLEVVREAVGEHESELRQVSDLTTFIVAFRGESTVYELDAELMWNYVEGEMTWREVTDAMLISQ